MYYLSVHVWDNSVVVRAGTYVRTNGLSRLATDCTTHSRCFLEGHNFFFFENEQYFDSKDCFLFGTTLA